MRMLKLKSITESLRNSFLQGLRRCSRTDPSVIPVIGSLTHPYFKQFVEIYSDHKHAEKSTKIMLKSPLVGYQINDLTCKPNTEEMGYQHVYQAWCKDFNQLTDSDFNDLLSVYEKGQGIQETDQRIVDQLLIATGFPPQSSFEEPIFLTYRNATIQDEAVEQELENYRIDFCTMNDFHTRIKHFQPTLIQDEIRFAIQNRMTIGAYHKQTNEIVGWMTISSNGVQERMYTYPEHRRRGIAGAITARTIKTNLLYGMPSYAYHSGQSHPTDQYGYQVFEGYKLNGYHGYLVTDDPLYPKI
uniref:GCN5-related N-acetyltransferase Rv2170-like domain-containing protein n=1 Tax=Clytia hemisphaerica TaxID=252671 RepID=A0A7M5WXP9_9CNID